jgi:hypothetical protein
MSSSSLLRKSHIAQAFIAKTAINQVCKIAQNTISKPSFNTQRSINLLLKKQCKAALTSAGAAAKVDTATQISKQGQITYLKTDKPGEQEKAGN